MRAIALRLAPSAGIHPTALKRSLIMRADDLPPATPLIYGPMLCVCLQGDKHLALGKTLVRYGEGDCFVVAVDLPITGTLVRASKASPYLAFAVGVEPADVAQVDLAGVVGADAELGLAAGVASPELLDAVLRTMRLLEKPKELAVLGPMVMREVVFRLLQSAQGAMLRHLVTREGAVAQVAKAIAWIRDNYSAPMQIDWLAKHVGMSQASFHRHFKAVTSFSPLQYQKQIRLQSARALLISERSDVGSVSSSVGYESTTQFTREYSRMFGAPPRRDAERIRQGLVPAPSTLLVASG